MITEMWPVGLVGMLLAVIGYLIKMGLDDLREEIKEIKNQTPWKDVFVIQRDIQDIRKEAKDLSTTVSRMVSGLDQMGKIMAGWDQDRTVQRERLNVVESDIKKMDQP